MDTGTVWFAFGLTLFAGLSTGIGSLIGFLSKEFNPKFLAGSLGFSAGVMIYVSLIEIFAKARAALSKPEAYGDQGYLVTTLAFFAGIGLIAIIDRLVPNYENPHELRNIGHCPDGDCSSRNNRLLRMGLFSALAIGIHNFPEGLATFVGALQDPVLGVSIAVAIAIHNIPEGVAVSAPIYYATGSRKKAFWLSFLSGLAEPAGALIGFFLLQGLFSARIFGLIFAAVAGIMVYISLDELLPTSEEFGQHHISIAGLVAGMALMAVSLVLFA